MKSSYDIYYVARNAADLLERMCAEGQSVELTLGGVPSFTLTAIPPAGLQGEAAQRYAAWDQLVRQWFEKHNGPTTDARWIKGRKKRRARYTTLLEQGTLEQDIARLQSEVTHELR